jgi:hypothetical protein
VDAAYRFRPDIDFPESHRIGCRPDSGQTSEDRQWFKSHLAMAIKETPRAIHFATIPSLTLQMSWWSPTSGKNKLDKKHPETPDINCNTFKCL